MIYITGDTHGDKSRFKKAKKQHIKKNDVLVICGDFGFVWNDDKAEAKVLKWIGKRRYKVLFCDGSNENHKLLSKYPTVELFSGKARQIYNNLYCLLRGEIYDIDGTKMLAFGGGDAHERYSGNVDDPFLLPSGEEMENASANLRKIGDKVDLIVTHDVPTRLKFFVDPQSNDLTHLNDFLEDICSTVTFKQWYFGKYHGNKFITPCYNMMFTAIKKFENKEQK